MGNNCFIVAVFRGWATIQAMRKAWTSPLLSARTGEVVTILSGLNELSRSVSERKPPSISTNVAKLRASISTLVFSLDGQETALQFHLQIVTQLRRSHNPFRRGPKSYALTTRSFHRKLWEATPNLYDVSQDQDGMLSGRSRVRKRRNWRLILCSSKNPPNVVHSW